MLSNKLVTCGIHFFNCSTCISKPSVALGALSLNCKLLLASRTSAWGIISSGVCRRSWEAVEVVGDEMADDEGVVMFVLVVLII